MKLRIIGLLFLLSGCVNIANHYGVTLCGNKACQHKEYDGKGSVVMDTKYDYDYQKILGAAVIKATKSCLVGYAVIHGSFPSDEEVFAFHWKHEIKADYILFNRLETTSSFILEPPFKTRYLEQEVFPRKIALIYFYVDNKRAITCFDPTNLNNY
jgi:hypothetical protein